jgi:hypothetical protein
MSASLGSNKVTAKRNAGKALHPAFHIVNTTSAAANPFAVRPPGSPPA